MCLPDHLSLYSPLLLRSVRFAFLSSSALSDSLFFLTRALVGAIRRANGPCGRKVGAGRGTNPQWVVALASLCACEQNTCICLFIYLFVCAILRANGPREKSANGSCVKSAPGSRFCQRQKCYMGVTKGVGRVFGGSGNMFVIASTYPHTGGTGHPVCITYVQSHSKRVREPIRVIVRLARSHYLRVQ